MNKKRILLLGGTGQLGWELRRSLCCLGELVTASRDGAHGPVVDVSDPDALVDLFDTVRPNLVVNAAAYTAVDKAESDRRQAQCVNAEAVGMIGELARSHSAGVIHYSTDFVFSGASTRSYREGDSTDPLNVYGQTKLEGEKLLLASGADALVFRTSWVYGLHGQNFLRTMLRLFREREQLGVVDDQVGSPTWSRLLAEVTGQVLTQVLRNKLDLSEVRGVYHLSAAGEASWYGFARAILAFSSEQCHVRPITTADYPTPATRPAYSVLDNGLFQETFGLALPDWKASLALCMEGPVAGMGL